MAPSPKTMVASTIRAYYNGGMGFMTAERRAIVAAILAFYALVCLLAGLAAGEWDRCFYGLAAVYGLGYFSVVAGYFWARWYGIGLGLSGLVIAATSIWQVGFEPVLVFFGVTHGLAALGLWGRKMAGGYDGRSDWRERFHMDENATHRLGKAVTRVGMSLPMIVMYALAPKDGAMMTLMGIAGLGVAVTGVVALIRLNTWGLFAIAGGALSLFVISADGAWAGVQGCAGVSTVLPHVGLAGSFLLAAAVVPFVAPIARYVLKR